MKNQNVFIVLLFLITSQQLLFCATLDSFRLGVENISDPFLNYMRGGKTIGLITNQTGIDQGGRRTVDILVQKGLNVTCMLAPEHGLDGKADAGELVKDSIDEKTGISVFSLYGSGTGKKISQRILDQVDILMFDIQDSGMRHYTYISTLMYVMRAAAQADKEVVVLDRPNPLGMAMEGPTVVQGLKSFISIASIPVRHGMTVGELAWYFNEYELEKSVKLHVVKMKSYDRRRGLANNLPAPLSPGLRSMQACYGYSFLGLLGESTPFGIGLATPLPFQCITLPSRITFSENKWRQLQALLKVHGIESSFHQYVSPRSNGLFKGLRLEITDINKVYSFNALFTVYNFFKKEGVPISFTQAFDNAMGTRTFREIFQDKKTQKVLVAEVNQQLKEFYHKATRAFMYYPMPKPRLLK